MAVSVEMTALGYGQIALPLGADGYNPVPLTREVWAVPCPSCGRKSGPCYGGHTPFRDGFLHPDRVRAASKAKFERWITAHDSAIRAGAWDEGYDAAIKEHGGTDYGVWPNPYRK